ncbi:MAG TPA: methyltransferase domain-containing protein [Ignavibacteria bacterium]|nr:methyltransferase domain-containing protein [Ignavibacteria bacterium]
MNRQQQKQLEQQRKTWNQYSGGWKKWDELLMTIMRPVSDRFIEILQLKGNEHILDVASGTGEPGLTLSTLLPEGRVTGSDLSENMVEIAIEHTKQRGIINYQSEVCDASNMPFENNFFDHVICRFGIMFFPDIEGSLREMTRELKPGGKLIVTVWAGPELNPFLTLLAKTVIEKLKLPKPPSDAPGLFRCAQPGLTNQLIIDAGLDNVTESNIIGEATFDSAKQYWEVFSDVAGPIMQALNNVPQEVVADVKETVLSKAGNLIRDGKMYAGWEAILTTGIKK